MGCCNETRASGCHGTPARVGAHQPAEVGHTFTSSSCLNFCKIMMTQTQACAPPAAVNSPPRLLPELP